MSLTVHHAADIPYYQGEHAIDGIQFHHARQTLGVTAWGMNVLSLAPHTTGYPEHDHASDGQEEVYVVLEGALQLHADGVVHELVTGSMVRVPPTTTRKLVTTDQAARVLALGATPGKAYEPGPGM
mgnify:CR=1 FL=1